MRGRSERGEGHKKKWEARSQELEAAGPPVLTPRTQTTDGKWDQPVKPKGPSKWAPASDAPASDALCL